MTKSNVSKLLDTVVAEVDDVDVAVVIRDDPGRPLQSILVTVDVKQPLTRWSEHLNDTTTFLRPRRQVVAEPVDADAAVGAADPARGVR